MMHRHTRCQAVSVMPVCRYNNTYVCSRVNKIFIIFFFCVKKWWAAGFIFFYNNCNAYLYTYYIVLKIAIYE